MEYLGSEVQPEDFVDLLPRYFDDVHGRSAPPSARGTRARRFFSTPEGSGFRFDFLLWVENNVRREIMHEEDARNRPSYLYFDEPALVGERTWVVHFTDHAHYILRQGFLYGTPDAARLGLTRHRHDEEVTEPGWNFGFLEDDAPAHAAKEGYLRYGRDALVFQTSGVAVTHMGDGERQVIFWGPGVRRAIPLLQSEDERSWYVFAAAGGKRLRSGSFDDVLMWVVDRASNGDERMCRDLPEVAPPRLNKARAAAGAVPATPRGAPAR